MDIPVLQQELTLISKRWEELDSVLTDELVRFKNWMLENFPKPANAGFYDPHLPFRLYPAATAHCASALLRVDTPYNAEAFIFEARDRDGETYNVGLPFGWLQDKDTFKQTVQAQVNAEQAKLDAAKPSRDAKLQALAEARALMHKLEDELRDV